MPVDVTHFANHRYNHGFVVHLNTHSLTAIQLVEQNRKQPLKCYLATLRETDQRKEKGRESSCVFLGRIQQQEPHGYFSDLLMAIAILAQALRLR